MNEFLPVSLSLFPGGRFRALTLSFDDGGHDDRKLVEILNRHGLRAAFNLITSFLDQDGYVARKEIAELYRGHEVASHTTTHPFPQSLPSAALLDEVLENRRDLEKYTGYPVRGLAYPFGNWGRESSGVLPSSGLRYARTTDSTKNFFLPADFYAWHPTMYHKEGILEKADEFLALNNWRPHPYVFFVWGHGHDFPRDKNWDLLEDFGKKLGKNPDIWYATPIEIADYCAALKRVEFSADFSTALNPTAAELWISAGSKAVALPPGSLTELASGKSQKAEFWKI